MAHTGITLAGFSTVLEMASSVPVDTSAFAYAGSNLCSAADSPAPGAEMQYLVLMDYGDRRTVIASQFMGDGGANIWQRQIYQDVWRQTRWVPIATATPPQEYDLPLETGYTKAASHACNYSKAQDGTVLVHIAIEHTSGALPTGYLHAASLPAGYWPTEIIGHQYNASDGAYINPDGGIFYSLTDARKTLIDTLEFRTS